MAGARTRRVARHVVAVLAVLALVAAVWSERDQLRPLADVTPAQLVLVTALVVVGHFINASEFWLLYRSASVRVGLVENYLVFAAGQLANHLPGQVGTLYRLRFMKVVHGTSYGRSAAVYGTNLATTAVGASLTGLAGVVAAGLLTDADVAWPLAAIFAAVAAVATSLAFIPLPAAGRLPDLVRRPWLSMRAGVEEIRSRRGVAVSIVGLEAVKYLLAAWRFDVAFALLGVQESFWFFLVLATAAGLASAYSLTPAAIGVREALLTGAAVALGSPAASGLLGATVDRAAILLVSVVVGGAALGVTYRRMRQAA